MKAKCTKTYLKSWEIAIIAVMCFFIAGVICFNPYTYHIVKALCIKETPRG